ncbi:MAG: amino acid permease [Planctomycetota bacterium]|jgi:amino acid transporter
MSWKQIFGVKSLEMLREEAAGENRLRRILGPIGLTSLGVGAIIGAGIFVMTGRIAANDSGPAILLSFAVAGVACALAAFCYAEFSSMVPVAGSAYTYAYATLGELIAWIIGWDLVLEYAMSAATVASAWSEYFNKLLHVCFDVGIPEQLCKDPWSGGWVNLPAIVILGICTVILVVGIRESAMSNTVMVIVKLGVVLFVIGVGYPFVVPANWTDIPYDARNREEQFLIPGQAADSAALEFGGKFLNTPQGQELVAKFAKEGLNPEQATRRAGIELGKEHTSADELKARTEVLTRETLAMFQMQKAKSIDNADVKERLTQKFAKDLPKSAEDIKIADSVIALASDPAAKAERVRKNFGLFGQLGGADRLVALDESTRSNFMPYGISGVIFGAAMVFFAFIGFDSISTHSEEAINPQRDLPIGILASLVVCTILYLGVSAVLTGMVPYYMIDTKAAIASAFSDRAALPGAPQLLKPAAALIAIGGLAGMTSVLLITFLSQARVFLAMARDGLLPHAIFGVVHEKFRTPARSTILTGVLMMFVAGFTPISVLEEMVNIGTLFAFVVVCGSVMLLRIRRPEAPRPFRCPFLFVVAPAGILVNVILMMFLPLDTWIRLVVWLAIGLVIYFCFGFHYSVVHRLPKNANP